MTLPSNIINTATFRHFGNVIIADNPTILSPNIGPQCVQTRVAIATISKSGDMLLSKRLPVKKEQLRDIYFWQKVPRGKLLG